MAKQDKLSATVTNTSTSEHGGTGFIIRWTILVTCALVITFLGRLFGLEDSPLPFHTSVFALFTGILAIVCIVIGLYLLFKGAAQRRALTKRNGIMLVVFGVFMLGGFFMFKSVVLLIFG